MSLHRFPQRSSGSALVMALLCAAVLTSLGATTFLFLQNRYRVVHQAASWKEALLAAEGGVEIALTEIRKSLYSPANAWEGWELVPAGQGSAAPEQVWLGWKEKPTRNSPAYVTTRVLSHSGEGGQRSTVKVIVDFPSFLIANREQWYRIRAIGITEIPGGAEVAGERPDIFLRKLDLRFDRRTRQEVSTPQVTRVVEAIVKPVGAFRLALFGASKIDLTNQNIVIDSWDSRNTEKYPGGLYPTAFNPNLTEAQLSQLRQANGDIATSGDLINAGGAHVYGDALTNGGTVLNAENVSGQIRNDFYQEVLSVTRPSVLPDAGTPLYISSTQEIAAKAGSPSNFQFGFINLNNETLKIRGAADGSPTYCQIVVTGDVSLSGDSQIVLDPGVYVRIFVQGNASFSGNGFVNPGLPIHLQIYGVDRPTGTDGQPMYGSIKISGNGGFSGAVYAPTYNVELKGGGTNDNIYGSFVGNSVKMNGVQSVHYDEAMADGGMVVDYKIVSWFEDEG